MARRHQHLLAFVLYVIVIGGFYFSVLTGHQSLRTNGSFPTGPFFVGDPLAGGPITLPLERLASASWAHLHLPIIDPYQGYGIPLLANQGVPVYLPQLFVHLLFPHNYSIWNVVNLIGIALGTFLLASCFGQRFFGGMAAGTAASLAGVAPPNLNVGMLNPFAVLPFVLLSIRYVIDPTSEHRMTAWLGVVTSVALLSLSGFQEVLPLMAVVIFVYTVALAIHFQTLRFRPILILSTALSGVLGVVIGSVGLLPPVSALQNGSSLNGPDSYALHVPLAWLSTLTVPSVVERAMLGQPQDLGQTVWTLGSPLLLLVVVLALALALRGEGKQVRWYVWPSMIMVVYGILGYADVFHVLKVFDVPLLHSILTIRFLQFAWWIPWCLLLGSVISHARHLRWLDLLAALVIAGLFDLFFVIKFRDALIGQHLARYLVETLHATILAGAIALAFAASALIARWVGPRFAAAAMAIVVLGSCIYYLPTNFFPASADTALSSLRISGTDVHRGDYLAYLGTDPQPTTYYSVQVWGPIIPLPYQKLVSTIFSASETDGYGALYDARPTFALLSEDLRLVTMLRSLGVNVLVLTNALPTSMFGSIPRCGATSDLHSSSGLCSLGHSSNVGGPPGQRGFAYSIIDASPIVDATAQPVAVGSTQIGMRDLLRNLSPQSSTLPERTYVTSNDHHLIAAKRVVGISRTASTESVTVSVRSKTAGIVVLRETYMHGMHASVNGRGVTTMPVDGGLWTAVTIGAGDSKVVLDYASMANLVEFGLAWAGMLAVLLAWLVLGVTASRRRRPIRMGPNRP